MVCQRARLHIEPQKEQSVAGNSMTLTSAMSPHAVTVSGLTFQSGGIISFTAMVPSSQLRARSSFSFVMYHVNGMLT